MAKTIRKVGVLGSGVMGSAIAAHFANVGIPSLVLDIAGADGKVKSIVDGAVKAMSKSRPSPLYTKDKLGLIETGTFEEDSARISECDWIIEVVKEDMAIKKLVLGNIAEHINDDAWLTSNTSGLSLQEMSNALPENLRPRFLGTHFFNPPRYMKLLELIPTKDTSSEILSEIEDFGRNILGKGIVLAKDTPNFIANRIGVHAMMVTMKVMQEMGLSVEEVDALTGPAMARPKTATFKLADLVGLDTFVHVADNVYDAAVDDEARDLFIAPEFLKKMVEKNLLGRKSGGGFYKMIKEPKKNVLTLDLETLEFREKEKAKFAEIEQAKQIDDPAERIKMMVNGKGRGSIAVWKMLAPSLSYSAMRLGEICDEASAIDRAICWGFNWEFGPFEVWDILGFRKTTERMREDGLALPEWVNKLYESGAENIYTDGKVPTVTGEMIPLPVDPRDTNFNILRKNNLIRSNPSASLLDMGDGIMLLEFHSKMNALGQDHIQMIMTACTEAEKNGQGLVVGNPAENFSAGANLMMILMEAMEGNYDDLNMIVRAFQGATDRLEFCNVPVVTAPHALALGGGCEVTMGGNAIRAAAETYIGLVEFGAGVIPAGGGCVRVYRNNVARLHDKKDLFPALKTTFETIGTAAVATSAAEAVDMNFLKPGDSWSVNNDHRFADAKQICLAMADAGFQPPAPDQAIPVMGREGVGLCESVLYNMEQSGWISEHDHKIGGYLALVLSGGDIPGPTTITHEHMLDLEREYFLRLCGERKSMERMESLLKRGKPLRN
jgi:3-hydroxyacyl-CoA dehydrogenase